MTDIDADFARRLVEIRYPQWAGWPVRAVDAQGHDNRTFRLGDTLKLRLPRSEAYAAQAVKEARWLKILAPHLPVAIPEVVRLGDPATAYPLQWSVQTWIEGEPAGAAQARDVQFAEGVAGFLRALRAIDASRGPEAGAHSFHRGGDLRVYDVEARAAAEVLRGEIDGARAIGVWEATLGSRWSEAPVWVHGDVAAGNLLVRDGRLCAVIDFGCLAVGDPACDLTIAWTLFEGAAREAFVRGVALDDATWTRARGWALWKAMITLARDRGDEGVRRVVRDVLAEALR
jgi:aminoglycoside phosphotransferase (APT) family kinase protein